MEAEMISKKNPNIKPEPTAEQDMMEMLVDLMYQVTLIELGVI